VGKSYSVAKPYQSLGIGERLAWLREGRQLSRRELAKRCGLSPAYVSRIENGERRPSIEAVRLLAKALGTSPHFLETGDTDGAYVYLSSKDVRLLTDALNGPSAVDPELARLYDILKEAL
jgi:transcriptional regulator with XRE-family HTH domain